MMLYPRDEITPEPLYLNRRRLMRGLGLALAGATLSGCQLGRGRRTPQPDTGASGRGAGEDAEPAETAIPAPTPQASADRDELGHALTSYESIIGYTNYYEFTLSKEGAARLARNLRTSPWEVQVDGLVAKPRRWTLEELLAWPQEERIYRMRCVEGWAMVIPWVGFPLARILEEASPSAEARFVRFETLTDPEQMPGVKDRSFPWPYVEGLRLDEAMHPLTILATGLYGKPLMPQNGAPVRLVVPWKYGFKSIKAIVRISLVAEMPISFWMETSPREYGFYANVNPDVPHPRWSQASERVIGQAGRRKTLLFNGYEEEVAHLYAGMDLRKDF